MSKVKVDELPEAKVKVCLRCGHEWMSRIHPRACSRCKSYRWNEERVRRDERPTSAVEVGCRHFQGMSGGKCVKCGLAG